MQRALANFLLSLALLALGRPTLASDSGELIVCGWDEVFILQVDQDGISTNRIWTWKASDDASGLPGDLRDKFRTTDDCKPLENGRKILISSSSGGVALVERATGKALFHAFVGNAHSIELLPNNRIAVAGSRHEQGNCVAIFDVDKPRERVFSTELDSGHGVVWDESREILWALGFDQLQAFRLKDWDSSEPALELAAAYKLPDRSGHDLVPVPNSKDLIVTTAQRVFHFDRDERTFSPHPELGEMAEVKSVSIHPRTGQMVFIQAEGPNWWASRIHTLNPSGQVHLAGERLYKARWNVR